MTTHEIAEFLNRDLPEFYRKEIREEREAALLPKEVPSVLLVGGAGYIGSVLARHLLEAGYRVKCLDNLLYNNRSAISALISNPNFQFVEGDFTDAEVFKSALENSRFVVLLAGLVGDPITKKYPEASKQINEDGMRQAIELLNGRNLRKVVFISTCSNYGMIEENMAADENFALKPLSLYAHAKVEAEKHILSLKGKVDYHPTLLRFATAFGLSPRMRFDLTVSEFTQEIFCERPLSVYDGATWRPYCHVQDFALVIRRVLEALAKRVSFEVFNAGGDKNNFTKDMIVRELRSFFPQSKINSLGEGADRRNYKVSFEKIKTRLFFEPRFSVRDGIQELVEALKQGQFSDVDQNKGFYGNYTINYKR